MKSRSTLPTMITCRHIISLVRYDRSDLDGVQIDTGGGVCGCACQKAWILQRGEK